MTDAFAARADHAAGPSRAPFAITPNDTVPLAVIPKRIYVGTGGAVTLRGVSAAGDVTYRNVGNGVYLDVRPRFIRATGTTATDLIGEG